MQGISYFTCMGRKLTNGPVHTAKLKNVSLRTSNWSIVFVRHAKRYSFHILRSLSPVLHSLQSNGQMLNKNEQATGFRISLHFSVNFALHTSRPKSQTNGPPYRGVVALRCFAILYCISDWPIRKQPETPSNVPKIAACPWRPEMTTFHTAWRPTFARFDLHLSQIKLERRIGTQWKSASNT